MVLGHDKCGALKGAIGECSSDPDTGLPEIFANICPAVYLARNKSADNVESRAIDLNVIAQAKILTQSPLFKKRVADGSFKILGARYNLQSGKVAILDADN